MPNDMNLNDLRDSFYLWHLEETGIITRTETGWTAPLWEDAKAAETVTVALIDTGIDTKHPNLEGAISTRQVDYGPRHHGCVYEPVTGDPAVPVGTDVAGLVGALSLSAAQKAELTDFGTHLMDDVETIDLADPSRFFGSHGTACAGLIGGRPPAPDPNAHPFYSAMVYYGANPHCNLTSFATPYSHEIKPCIKALLAAYLSGAEVILMPRGLPDVRKRGTEKKVTSSRVTRIDTPGDTTEIVDEDQAKYDLLLKDSELFEALLKAVAKKCYVILAAGNEGYADKVSYPASQVLGDNVIVVSAVNRNQERATYANGSALDGLLWMLSDEGSELDQDAVSIDTRTRGGTDYDFTPHFPEGKENVFSPWAPLTLDVRGAWGYAVSANDDPPVDDDGIDRASLYTLFGGTSAACSIAAGVISLLVQAGKLDKANPADLAGIKKAMTDNGLVVF